MAVLEYERAESRIPYHQPAMVSEVLHLLLPVPGDRVLDLTTGTGGHALALAAAVAPDGFLLGIDADADALSVAEQRLAAAAPCRVHLVRGRFSQAREIAREAGIDAFDAVIGDLGVGTHQLLQPQRGFSFDSTARLDMRFDTTNGLSAWDVVNRMPREELADIFWQFGEERYSRQIAARICALRSEQPIDTPHQLAELIKSVVARRSRPKTTWRIHPATRVMMALRIFVNHEMEELNALLDALPDLLAKGGRACMLTYHSLEARRVKRHWREQARQGVYELLTRRAVKPSDEEMAGNPKVRSAQLRAVRRL